MDHEQKLTEMLKDAMRSGDKIRLMAIRSVKSLLTNERTRSAGPLDPDRAIQLLTSHRKKMQGALEQYREAGRDNLVQSAEMEIAICDSLLPAQMGQAELDEIIRQAIADAGATSMRDLGRLMGPLMKQLAGKADGNLVRERVSHLLGG